MRRFFPLILVVFLLTGCAEFKDLIGIEEMKVDFPPGEYVGTAKLVKGDGVMPDLETKPSLALPSSADETEENSEEGTITKAPVVIDPKAKKIKLNFIPKDPGITDGIGVLTLNDESHRFYWRSDGDNSTAWNVRFTKDNNIYTNLHDTFKFDGLITKTKTENKLEGMLYFDYDSVISQYFVAAAQVFKPKIIPPKEVLSIKGGDSFDVQVEMAGDDQEQLEAFLSKAATEKDPAVEVSPAIKQMSPENKGVTTISLATEKGLAKGSYMLRIVRSKEHKSNSIAITVN